MLLLPMLSENGYWLIENVFCLLDMQFVCNQYETFTPLKLFVLLQLEKLKIIMNIALCICKYDAFQKSFNIDDMAMITRFMNPPLIY